MNVQGMTKLREYIAKDKPKKLREGFKIREPLIWGWLLPYLLPLEDFTWQRWDYWARTKVAGALLPDPIPQIEWSSNRAESSPARKMLEASLCCVTKYGEWRGWSSPTHFNFFLDWLLFALGDPRQKQLPAEREEYNGASDRLYQIFNLEPLLAYPHDYFGDIIAENCWGRHIGFFPTPMEIAHLKAMLLMGGEDCRAKSVMDPALGTGRLLLAASNYSMRLYGNDINETVIKACLVNGYLYAPWLVRALPFLDKPQEITDDEQPGDWRREAGLALPPLTTTTTTETKPQLELTLA